MALSHHSQTVRRMVPGITDLFDKNKSSPRERVRKIVAIILAPKLWGEGWVREGAGTWAMAKFSRPVPAQDLLQETWEEIVSAEYYINPIWGTSLVAQWLRICLPMQGTLVRALVREDPTCRGAAKRVRHNY